MANVRLGALLAASVLALASCQDSGESAERSAPTVAPAIDPTGEVAFPRTLQADRLVEVRVFTSGDVDGVVTSAELVTPLFSSTGVRETNVRLTQGWAARLRLPLGEVQCDPAAEPTTVTVTVSNAEAQASAVVALPTEVLADIHAAECEAKVATDAAAPALLADAPLGSAADETPPAWDTVVRFTRGPSAADATVTGLSGNVIFSLELLGTLPVDLSSAQDQIDVPVRVSATRCDSHAFAESKKTFVFGAWIVVDGVERRVEYVATGDARATLQALFDRCGAGSDADGVGGQ